MTATSRPSPPPSGPPAALKPPFSWRFSKHPKLFRFVSDVENLIEFGPAGPPSVLGPADLSDLLAPGTAPASYPAYYINQPVHRMNGLGFLDPKQPARGAKVMRAIPYIREDRIAPWIEQHIATINPAPRRILDVGSGIATTGRAYARLFPEAEVVCVDLAPPQMRVGMQRAAEAGLANIAFYHMDAGDLSYFEDDSFDVVHVAHLLHEMDQQWIGKTVRESIRVCRTGGLLAFFDWRIPQTEAEWKHRETMVRVGQEPYMVEYARANFPAQAAALDCPLQDTGKELNSATWLAIKGPHANDLLATNQPD